MNLCIAFSGLKWPKGPPLMRDFLVMQVLESCLEKEHAKSQGRSLASLFQGNAQKACKRQKVGISGPAVLCSSTDSPDVFRFNFSDD